MPDYRQKLKALLYELFQFDSADLDFGFYAVMNQKRERIARFIEHDLLDAVSEGLQHIAQHSAFEARQAFEQARLDLLQLFPTLSLQGDDIPADALANPLVASAPVVRAYQAALANRDAAVVAEDMEAQIYNDLYNFFARYYQDGDFISQRRYGRSDKYAIPYNGQEVHLHWANYDQYYVKTGVYFNNYSFRVPGGAGLEAGASVQVRLSRVDTPRDNLKGDRRFFIHAEDQTVTWDGERQTLVIPMEYRPLTEQESADLSGRNLQEALLEQAHAAILKALPSTALKARLLEPDPQKGGEQGRLAYHLRRYAAANTRDFFVHKDLGGFLRRGFDYYLKAEVLHLEDINFDDLLHARRAAARLRTTRGIGLQVIAFLDQLESFQRRLFLKRKFVLQSDYCLTLDKLPAQRRAEFYAEILGNPRQLAEWESLYGLTLTPQTDLNLYPRLMLDTAFFDAAFRARLLACFDDLDAATDGLLVHGENFQALNLLLPRYRGRVKCIYIDPPYNTGGDGFVYKDCYQHASWMSMMLDRLEISRNLLVDDTGVIFVSIDDNEQANLRKLIDQVFDPDNFVANVIWQKRYAPSNDAANVSDVHEYVMTFANQRFETSGQSSVLNLPRTVKVNKAYKNLDGDPKGPWRADNYITSKTPAERPNLFYPIIHPTTDQEIWPPESSTWRYSREKHEQNIRENRVYWGKSGESTVPAYKRYLSEVRDLVISSLWEWKDVGLTDEAKKELQALLGRGGFETPKPARLLTRITQIATTQDQVQTVLDFFAGSGTTAHGVMQYNKEHQTEHKYILVEMGDYFDTVLKPRLQKVAYSEQWKDGRPVANAGGQAQFFNDAGQSHMFQYVRLESYDDVFHNIRLRAKSGPQLSFLEQLPDYFLSYKLERESQGSPGLLDLRQFQRPFEYQLLVTGADGVLEPHTVDLVATFNFLLGLAVQSVRHYAYQGRPYARVCGTLPNGQRACVLWRNVLPLDELDAERDWALAHVLHDVEYERLYVNGENTIPGALLTEDEFQRRMFQEAR